MSSGSQISPPVSSPVPSLQAKNKKRPGGGQQIALSTATAAEQAPAAGPTAALPARGGRALAQSRGAMRGCCRKARWPAGVARLAYRVSMKAILVVAARETVSGAGAVAR